MARDLRTRLIRLKAYLAPLNGSGGFTLVEMLVATLIFSIIAMAVSLVFVRAVVIENRGQGAQKVQENALFALESMAREIRVGVFTTNQDSPSCSRTMITFQHPVNGEVSYGFDGAKSAITRTAGGIVTRLTGDDVQTSARFCVLGSGVDQDQARVTILMNIKNKAKNSAEQMTFNLQTTVSSRDIGQEQQLLP